MTNRNNKTKNNEVKNNEMKENEIIVNEVKLNDPKLNEAKSRIKELVKLIDKHNDLYHKLDKPEISDEVFDNLLVELQELEDKYPEYKIKNSPTNKVGGKILRGFKKVRHINKQYSFDKIFNQEQLIDWENKNNKILIKENINQKYNYICELKIDGLKIILNYKNGILDMAATRGDGQVGEDITDSVLYIKDIPKRLSENINITVIGECWLSKDKFEKINKDLQNENKEIYANPRNLAAGTLRNLDTSVIAERGLSFFAYHIDRGDINIRKDDVNNNSLQDDLLTSKSSQSQDLLHLQKLGFIINEDYKIADNINDIQDIFTYWDKERNNRQYAIDGLVIKINNNNIYYKLGWTNKSPRGAVAYKFTAEEATSIVENIICQVGRTGAITPVAILSPTIIAGSIVRRATLHNRDEIERLDVRVGDTVVLRKAGDIIPEIRSVILELRNKKSTSYIFPTECPECKAKLILRGVICYCDNNNCYSRLVESLIHFASKKGMNIDGLGEKIIEEFYELELINKYYHSIYELKAESISGLFGFGERSANNIINSINKSKDVKLENFIYALGIRHIGESSARDLANYYKSIDNLLLTTEEELLKLNNIGTETSKELLLYINNKDFRKEIDVLNKILNINHIESVKNNNINITNKIFVITGTLSQSRDYFKSVIINNGGLVTDSISNKTDYLLCGTDAGSKLDKARKLNIKIINEEDFVKLL